MRDHKRVTFLTAAAFLLASTSWAGGMPGKPGGSRAGKPFGMSSKPARGPAMPGGMKFGQGVEPGGMKFGQNGMKPFGQRVGPGEARFGQNGMKFGQGVGADGMKLGQNGMRPFGQGVGPGGAKFGQPADMPRQE